MSPQTDRAEANPGHVGRCLGVLIDERCREVDGQMMTESPFIRFVQAFRAHFDRVLIFGRHIPGDYPVRYPIECDGVRFVQMPPYPRIPALLTRPWRWWPEIDRVLARELPLLDAVWLNPGHPVSLRALQRARKLGTRHCFGVMRGAYANDARHHEVGLRAPLAGAAMRTFLTLFARMAARHDVPCLAYGPQEVAWLSRHGVRAALVNDTLLTAEDLRGDRATETPPTDILTVGRLDPVKAYDVLIEAIAPLTTAEGTPARLRIVGSGPDETRLRALVARLGLEDRVSFAGHVDHGADLFGQYLSAAVYAQPSHTEGTPKTVIEAMGFGLPVVGSRVGAMAELVEGPPPAGLLVPPGDVEALRQALDQMLKDQGLRQACGAAARATWGEHTMDRAVARLLGVAAELGRWTET